MFCIFSSSLAGEVVDSLYINIILVVLVLVLAALLVQRQRQLKLSRPPADLAALLENLRRNLLSSRNEGKIQKIASQLSDILVNNLQSDRILFLRKQRRFMELNYVYGLKNIQRTQYRLKLTKDLMDRLVDGQILKDPAQLSNVLSPDMVELLKSEKFNLAFPIFWAENLFGVYFISTRLPLDHPMIKTFLLFLNQNLSVSYHITRLESTCQILERKVENDKKTIQRLENEKSKAEQKETEEDPGHLIEMFGHRKVEELVANLFDKVRAGLKAEKLVFVSRPNPRGGGELKYMLGVNQKSVTFDVDEFQGIFGKLQKRQVYTLAQLRELTGNENLADHLSREKMAYLSTFSLDDNEPGILFWAGKETEREVENRMLSRLERVGRRALVNAREFERIEEMSYTDGLTNLYNHRYFTKRLNEEIQRAIRYNRRVGLLLFDIDDFKLYNDNFGHQWGDELLRRMGRTLAQSLRSIDIVARYGGDEFGIIMPETDRATCGVFMDRLRHAISATDFRDQVNGFEGRITISIGSAIYPDDADSADRLFYCADKALFRSKADGRNRSTIFSEELLESDRGK